MAGGRPKKPVDLEKMKYLAMIGCTHGEIGAVLDISERTILRDKSFVALIDEGRKNGKGSLKRRMWECAMGKVERRRKLVKVKTKRKLPGGAVEESEEYVEVEYDHVHEPNSGMQIFLSKQMLTDADGNKYSDKVSTDVDASVNQKSTVEHKWTVMAPPQGMEMNAPSFYDPPAPAEKKRD